jgi:hypothetical protein
LARRRELLCFGEMRPRRADAWAGTTTAHVRLMLTVLGGPVEFERDFISAPTTPSKVACGWRLCENVQEPNKAENYFLYCPFSDRGDSAILL